MGFRTLKGGRRASIDEGVEAYVIPSLWDKKREVAVPDYRKMQSRMMCSSFVLMDRDPIGIVLRLDVGKDVIQIIESQSAKTMWHEFMMKEEYFGILGEYEFK
jgi:hypothetical protein